MRTEEQNLGQERKRVGHLVHGACDALRGQEESGGQSKFRRKIAAQQVRGGRSGRPNHEKNTSIKTNVHWVFMVYWGLFSKFYMNCLI